LATFVLLLCAERAALDTSRHSNKVEISFKVELPGLRWR